MSLRALIFDVDGTLADTEEAHRQAFNAAFKENGLPWYWGRRVYHGLPKVPGGRERLAHFVEALDVAASIKSTLQERIPFIHECKTRAYARLLSDGRVTLRPGVSELISEARAASVRLAIASTTTRANADELICGALGIQALGWFEVIATGEFGGRKKPSSDVYAFVLDKLGVQSAECIAFEGSEIGLAAAKGAGLFTVVTPTSWTASDDFSAADHVLEVLPETGSLAVLSTHYSNWVLNRKEAA